MADICVVQLPNVRRHTTKYSVACCDNRGDICMISVNTTAINVGPLTIENEMSHGQRDYEPTYAIHKLDSTCLATLELPRTFFVDIDWVRYQHKT